MPSSLATLLKSAIPTENSRIVELKTVLVDMSDPSWRKNAVEAAHGVFGDDIKVVVRMPETKNVITEANDRGLNRANPHTPCPDVQPFPNLVPSPTQNPPITYASGLDVDGANNT